MGRWKELLAAAAALGPAAVDMVNRMIARGDSFGDISDALALESSTPGLLSDPVHGIATFDPNDPHQVNRALPGARVGVDGPPATPPATIGQSPNPLAAAQQATGSAAATSPSAPGAMPHPGAPPGGTIPNINSTVGGGAPPTTAGSAGPGVHVPRSALPAGAATAAEGAASAAAKPGIINSILSTLGANKGKVALGAAGLAAGAYALGPNVLPTIASAVTGGAAMPMDLGNTWRQPPPAANAATPFGPSLAEANQSAKSAEEAETKRRLEADQDAARWLQQSQAAALQAQAEKAKHDIDMSNMTDKEKADAKERVDRELANLNNAAAMARTQAQETGSTNRTLITEAGATQRSDATNAVAQRGQDIQGRGQDLQYITQAMANAVATGQLSLDKANKQFEAYIKQAKLPSDILKTVSDSVTPFLPYLTARKTGELPPGFEAGGPMAQLVKAGGGKYDPAAYGAKPVTVDLRSMANQYGADKVPQEPMPSVSTLYQDAGTVPSIDSSPVTDRALPPMVNSVMPQSSVAPMSPQELQALYNSLGS